MEGVSPPPPPLENIPNSEGEQVGEGVCPSRRNWVGFRGRGRTGDQLSAL